MKDPKIKSTLEHIFEGNKIDWGNSDDFYTMNGQFSDFIGELLPGKIFLPMTFEYGTLNTKTTIGSIHSLHNMVLENQGFQFGYYNMDSREKIQHTFREMYFPSSQS